MITSAATNIMESAHATILAMLPRDLSVPARRMPHSGFTPTGAEAGDAELPVSRVLSFVNI